MHICYGHSVYFLHARRGNAAVYVWADEHDEVTLLDLSMLYHGEKD